MKKEQELLLRNLRIELDQIGLEAAELAARHLGLPAGRILQAEVLRRNLDARRGSPRFILHLRVRIDGAIENLPEGTIPAPAIADLPAPPALAESAEVVVLGSGPAGLFAAWRLSQAGLRPLIVERGPAFPDRHKAIEVLQDKGKLDPEANFHFGLGGAGTYSDGKLFTRLDHPAVRFVLEQLQAHGAGSHDAICVDAHPHVGTDRWPEVLESLKSMLEQAGCRFQFNTRVEGLSLRQGRLLGLRLADGELSCQACILAPGNSSRDLFAAMDQQGIRLQPKGLAVGLRMVHPQAVIDRMQYGRAVGHPALGPASYRLSIREGKHSVYSFCMCPGGTVIPTPTEEEALCTNGMSNSSRDSGEANAAMVVSIPAERFGSQDAMAAVALQRQLERAAYAAGGGDHHAPAQSLKDFLQGEPTKKLPTCRYRPGLKSANLARLLPDDLSRTLRQGLGRLCQRMPTLAHPEALLIGVETRTSSPVRILRGDDGAHPDAAGLFPAGEGAGYAGGITSSAVDGIRAADALIHWLARD